MFLQRSVHRFGKLCTTPRSPKSIFKIHRYYKLCTTPGLSKSIYEIQFNARQTTNYSWITNMHLFEVQFTGLTNYTPLSYHQKAFFKIQLPGLTKSRPISENQKAFLNFTLQVLHNFTLQVRQTLHSSQITKTLFEIQFTGSTSLDHSHITTKLFWNLLKGFNNYTPFPDHQKAFLTFSLQVRPSLHHSCITR